MRKIKLVCLCSTLFSLILAKLDDCKAGQSCTFMSRVDGWDIYKELPSYALTYPPKSESWKDPKTTLYLTMSSYRFHHQQINSFIITIILFARDKLCPITLYNLFTKAEFPDRVTVGVVQQNDETDIDCYDTYCDLMKKGQSFLRVNAHSLFSL